MRRRHTREEYLDLVGARAGRDTGIQLSTDMIVGFPGETEEDFRDTLTLVEDVAYHSMFSFKYSERPNTLASKRLPDDVPEDEKDSDWRNCRSGRGRFRPRLHAEAVGSSVEVLVDSVSRRRDTELSGRTTGNTVVNFPGDPSQLGPS